MERGIICEDRDDNCETYQEKVDPSAINDFSQATFRALHACVPTEINFFTGSGSAKEKYNLSDLYLMSSMLNGNYNGILRGMLTDSIVCEGEIYTEEVWI